MPVRILQFGNGELQPAWFTLRPTGTVVSILVGKSALAFFYGLGDTVPVGSEAPWLRVTSVERNADRREVLLSFDSNPDPTPRCGVINVDGRTFSMLQQGRPAQ